MSDILKTYWKLKPMNDGIVDNNVMHTMTGRITNSMQIALQKQR